jgi:hypothetical protein
VAGYALKDQDQDQKIAAFGSSYAPVGAAEGCDLLIFF